MHKIAHETIKKKLPPLMADFQKTSYFSMIIRNLNLFKWQIISTWLSTSKGYFAFERKQPIMVVVIKLRKTVFNCFLGKIISPA